jgi:hypothetical protein
MKKLVIIGSLALLVSACGILHKTTSEKETHLRDSLYKSDLQKSIESTVITNAVDTGHTVIRETSDSSFFSPAFKASKSYVLQPGALVNALASNYLRLDSGMLSVKLHYDTLTGVLQLSAEKKPEQGNVRKEKTTVVKNGSTIHTEQKTKGNEKRKQQIQIATKDERKVTTKTPDYSFIGWLVGLLVIIFLIQFIYNKFSAAGTATKNENQ